MIKTFRIYSTYSCLFVVHFCWLDQESSFFIVALLKSEIDSISKCLPLWHGFTLLQSRNWRNPILQTNFLSRIAFNIYKFIVKKKDRQNGATEWKVKGETCYGHRGKSPIRRDDKLRRGRCSCRHQIERSSLFSTILYIPLIFF